MNVHKEFFKYVIPSMLAFALSGIYAIADGFFVGNALGDNALAAVNIAYPLTAFLQAVGTGIGMGGAIEYAINMGTGNKSRGNQYFGMAILLLVTAGILLTTLLLAGGFEILKLFGAEGEILKLGKEYIRFIAIGAIFQILGTGLVPFIRNMGSAVAAMAAMIVGFVTNIALDYTFVWVLPWGMMGAAVATVAGQAMTFLVCLIFFIKKKEKPVFTSGDNTFLTIQKILKIGLSPFGLTYSPNLTLILINKSAALVGGAAAVTCYAPVSYISAVVLLLIQGVSDGSQPLLSLYYGEGDREKTHKIRELAYIFALIVGLCCMVSLFLGRTQIASLFGASDSITENVSHILPVFIVGFLFVCISRVTTAGFYATHKNVWAYILIYGEPAALAVFLCVLPNIFGIMGTWACVPLSQLVALVLSVFFILWETKFSIE